jgi:protocatechuate 3,4-dioxygenase beta subunit
MARHDYTLHSRRQVLQAFMALPTILTLTSDAGLIARAVIPEASAQAPELPPTPACADPEDVTPRQTEGPYFKRSSPERTSLLAPDMTGTRLLLTGYVFSRHCQPIEHALLDFWHADGRGQYDNQGFRCRGHQFTDAAGGYRLETVVPGLYPGRTRHIHVKVQAPNQPILTTQLYFPREARNATDGIFNPALVMTISDKVAGTAAQFNFVLDVG